MLTQEIIQRLDLAWPYMNTYSLVNFLLATFVSAILLYIIFFRIHIAIRLSVIVSLLLNVFFQWPLFIISNIIEEYNLIAHWFAFVVHVSVYTLLIFGFVTSRWLGRKYSPTEINIRAIHIIVTLILGALLIFLYLRRVPFDCTAIFAMIYDPDVTLLAREVSIKFAGSFLATASFGAFANAVAPVLIALSIAMAYFGIRCGKPLQTLGYSFIIIASVFLCLISGTKGLLIPSLIVVLMSSFLWNSGLLRRGIAIIASASVLLGSLVVYEIVRDRGSEESGSYPFAQCTAHLGACSEGRQLIQSLYERSGSLGLYEGIIDRLRKELESECAGTDVPVQKEDDTARKSRSTMGNASRTYLAALMYRALITPVQVAAWHYLYVEEVDDPGFSAMPFGHRITGSIANMPVLVYQKYTTIFSHGDKTSTGTAPTGFIMAYPAYIGLAGLVLALLAVIITDITVSLLLLRVPNALYPVGIGLSGVISFNFILSDFVTVMLSHGGAVAVALTAFFAVFRDKDTMKRPFDLYTMFALTVLIAVPSAIAVVVLREYF